MGFFCGLTEKVCNVGDFFDGELYLLLHSFMSCVLLGTGHWMSGKFLNSENRVCVPCSPNDL